MIMSVARIAMLAVRLGLRLFRGTGEALFVALRIHTGWVEAGNNEGGEQEARRSHGSSPLPGDGLDRIRARPLVIRSARVDNAIRALPLTFFWCGGSAKSCVWERRPGWFCLRFATS
jgi:hypothetical protein